MATILITGFTGINNRLPAHRLQQPTQDIPLADLTTGTNFDLDDSHRAEIRDGYTRIASMTGAHSGFSYDGCFVYVKGGTMYRFYPDSLTSVPLIGVGNDSQMRYTTGAGRIFFTNGAVIGEVKDGVCGLFGLTTVPFKAPTPAGQSIAHHKARLYVGKDNVLWISDVKPLSRVDLRHGFKQFPDRITMIAPSLDGLYVGTEKAVYFGVGGNPLKMPFTKVCGAGAKDIPVQYLDASRVKGLNVEGMYPVFTTDEGVCLGLPQGQIYNMTEDKYIMPEGTSGASMLKYTDGVNGQVHYIATYR